MQQKVTTEVIDERIKDRPLTRLSLYVRSKDKMMWECKVCSHQWEASANSIISHGSGCPKCAGNIKYTKQDVERFIANRPIILIGDYIQFDTPTKWKCLQCNHEWKASPNNILTKKSGCPICSQVVASKKKSAGQKDRVLENLKSKNLELLSPYTRVKDKHHIRCNTCLYEYKTSLNTIVNCDVGCMSCTGHLLQTNEIVDKRLKEQGRSIKRIGDYINATTKMGWECEYGHRWSAVPDSVLNAGTGCERCKYGSNNGFKFSRFLGKSPVANSIPTTLYLIRFKKNDCSFIKIGITTKTIAARFNSKEYRDYQIDVLKEIVYPLQEAFKYEQSLINSLGHYTYSDVNFAGKTECFQDIPEVFEILRQNNIHI